MSNTISRRNFLKGAAAGALGAAVLGTTGLTIAAEEAQESKAGLQPVFNGKGSKFEYGHFTAEAIVIDANKEEMNPNASFSAYHIMDYTAEVPHADSYDADGVTSDNNTSSSYVIVSGDDALLIDMGNGAASTAGHFGEDSEDEAVLEQLNTEFRELVLSLADGKNLQIAITHKHGDHIGYADAMANLGYTVLFPEGDVTDDILTAFDGYDFQTFVPGELQIPVGDVVVDTILCPGHTDASTIYVVNTPIITYNYDATAASATYLVMSGDAIGSGSSVWIFTIDALNLLNDNIDTVVEQLAAYTSYDAGLGAGEETGAKLLIEGGHGWQYENRLGVMNMDLEYAKSMQNLIHLLSEGDRWAYDGVDGLPMESWMKKGYIALKDAHNSWGNLYTAYFGTTLTSAAAISCPIAAMRQFAGLED